MDKQQNWIISRGCKSNTSPQTIRDAVVENLPFIRATLLKGASVSVGRELANPDTAGYYGSIKNVYQEGAYSYFVAIVMTEKEKLKIGREMRITEVLANSQHHRLAQWDSSRQRSITFSELNHIGSFPHFGITAKGLEMIRDYLVIYGGPAGEVGTKLDLVYQGKEAERILKDTQIRDETKIEINGSGQEHKG